jgi:hypothetical protein
MVLWDVLRYSDVFQVWFLGQTSFTSL